MQLISRLIAIPLIVMVLVLASCGQAETTEAEQPKTVEPTFSILLSTMVPSAIDEVGGSTYYTIWDHDDSFCVVVADYDEEALNAYIAEMKDYGYSENAQKTSLYGVTEYSVDNVNGYTTLEVYTVDTSADDWAEALNVDEDYFAGMSNIARVNIRTTDDGDLYMRRVAE